MTPEKEAVPTIGGVAGEATEYNQHVIHIQLPHNLICVLLRGRHRLK